MSERTNPSINPAKPVSLCTAAAAIAIIVALAALPGVAAAARVSGIFVTYQGQPTASRDLHFDNCITHDSFLAPTHNDGSFAQSLPPGCYDLRAERGAIVRHAIVVGETDVALGQVADLAPLAPARLFELQALFPTLLTSPAPSTAYIMTHDATVVPASAAVVPIPSSQSEWLRLKKQTEAESAAANGNSGASAPAPAPEFKGPLDLGAQPPNGAMLPLTPPRAPQGPAAP
jgi:hypothetical protein